MKTKRILLFTDDLKYACGISTYLFNFLKEYNGNEYEFFLLCSGGDAVERFREINKNVFIDEIFRERDRTPFRFLVSIIKLSIFVLNNSPQIIHAQNYYVANIAFWVSKFVKVETIQTHHNFFRETKRLKLFANNYQITVNEDMTDYYLNRYVLLDKNKIRTIRYGIPTQNISLPKNSKLKIVNAGRLIPEKGTQIFLDAVKLLPSYIFEKANFYLAGEGSELEMLRDRINRENIKINYLGVLTPLIDFLRISDILIFTSQWDAEGFPITIIEAGMCKNLIISSIFRGLNIHFINNVDGLIFKSNSPFELAEKLEYAINNDSIRLKLTENFYSKLNETFSIRNSVDKVIDFYNLSLLGRG